MNIFHPPQHHPLYNPPLTFRSLCKEKDGTDFFRNLVRVSQGSFPPFPYTTIASFFFASCLSFLSGLLPSIPFFQHSFPPFFFFTSRSCGRPHPPSPCRQRALPAPSGMHHPTGVLIHCPLYATFVVYIPSIRCICTIHPLYSSIIRCIQLPL